MPPDTLDPDAAKASERENLSYLLAQLGETMRMAVEKKHGVRIFQVVYSYSMDTVGQNVVVSVGPRFLVLTSSLTVFRRRWTKPHL